MYSTDISENPLVETMFPKEVLQSPGSVQGRFLLWPTVQYQPMDQESSQATQLNSPGGQTQTIELFSLCKTTDTPHLQDQQTIG